MLFVLIFLTTGCDSQAPTDDGDGGGSDTVGDTSATPSSVSLPVTVASKTSDHPYNGQGWSEGFVIDGDQGKELTLQRGVTYTFEMNNVAAMHSFYISTSAVGGGAGVYSDGVSGNFASGNETLTFTPGADTPDQLYYQCNTGGHTYMGWKINVTGTGSEGSSDSDSGSTDTTDGGNDDGYQNPGY